MQSAKAQSPLSSRTIFVTWISVMLTGAGLLSGCQLYHSDDRESFNNNALSGAPAHFSVVLESMGCVSTIDNGSREQIEVHRDSSDRATVDWLSPKQCRLEFKLMRLEDSKGSRGVSELDLDQYLVNISRSIVERFE